jgi:hypothetical protein
MVRDKAKAAAAMRIRMSNLRLETTTATTPTPNLQQAKLPFVQQNQQTGRDDERTRNTKGRGGGDRADNSGQRTQSYKAALTMEETTIITTETTLPGQSETVATTMEETSPTISDLTEHTNDGRQAHEDDMEEDNDGIADIMLNGIPVTIPKIIPNPQWLIDQSNNLNKKRYGIEIKILPEEQPNKGDPLPDYHHPRIFKSIACALLIAAPGTVICSTYDDKEAIISVMDIPTDQETIDYYLEAPTISTKTHGYHARIHVLCIKPLFIILKIDNLMTWLKENRIYLEENDLSTALFSTAGLIFFVHPRDALRSRHHVQLAAMFEDGEVPEFRIKSFLLKSGENKAMI